VALTAGTRLGPYEVIAAIGAGGMGEVYRARDTRLKRDVALKVLPDRFSRDPDRLARFQREAELLAALNHSNIAAVYGLESANGVNSIAMELVDGPTLAELLARGPLPVRDALNIARQVADALEGAHSKGVVHRDLKPSNIKVTADGKVKVLDFGLAKMLATEETSPASLSLSPTVSVQALSSGIILGTAAYMSPEQARGKAVDSRTDVWAFGCLLYEMLTGRSAFSGETVTDLLAAVIGTEPDWKALPATVPPAVEKLVRRCLQKDASRRFHHIADARLEIEDILSGGPTASAGVIQKRGSPWLLWSGWVVAAMFAFAAFLTFILWWSTVSRPVDRPVTRLELTLPDAVELTYSASSVLAISPDGRRVAFVGIENGLRRTYLRNLDEGTTRPLEGSDGSIGCFFSPDGRSLGIISNTREIKRISLADGLVSTVAAEAGINVLLGGTWLSSGRIVYVRDSTLWVVPDAGGEPKALTTLDAGRGEMAHLSPLALPGGGAVVFTIRRNDGKTNDVGIVDVSSGARTVILERAASPMYAASGHLLFVRDGALLAVPFDADDGEVSGSPVRLEERIPGGDEAAVAVAGTGTLVYSTTAADGYRLVSVSRLGVETMLNDTPRAYVYSRFSRDGRFLAMQIAGDVWIQDLSRRTFERIAGTENTNNFVWTHDGTRLVLGTPAGIRWVGASDSTVRGGLAGTNDSDFPTSVAPDDRTLIFMRYGSESGDIYTTSLKSGEEFRPLVKTPAYEGGAQLSPDGKWMAYVSQESGRAQVYLRAFPGPDRKWPVSTSGGTQPVWNGNGKELFYRDGEKMMAVQVSIAGEPRLSEPVVLFQRRYVFGTHISVPNYDVSHDGQQFVMIKDSAGNRQLNVVTNWIEELKARVR
jgi:eukaryotic-like serine/threonine-protein kinase